MAGTFTSKTFGFCLGLGFLVGSLNGFPFRMLEGRSASHIQLSCRNADSDIQIPMYNELRFGFCVRVRARVCACVCMGACASVRVCVRQCASMSVSVRVVCLQRLYVCVCACVSGARPVRVQPVRLCFRGQVAVTLLHVLSCELRADAMQLASAAAEQTTHH